jgi:hypothetical protein
MFAGKVVKMERREQTALDTALETLEEMEKYLEELKDADPKDGELRDLWDDCNSAYSGLWDFLQTYKRQFAEFDDQM